MRVWFIVSFLVESDVQSFFEMFVGKSKRKERNKKDRLNKKRKEKEKKLLTSFLLQPGYLKGKIPLYVYDNNYVHSLLNDNNDDKKYSKKCFENCESDKKLLGSCLQSSQVRIQISIPNPTTIVLTPPLPLSRKETKSITTNMFGTIFEQAAKGWISSRKGGGRERGSWGRSVWRA